MVELWWHCLDRICIKDVYCVGIVLVGRCDLGWDCVMFLADSTLIS